MRKELFEYQFIIYFGFPAKPSMRGILTGIENDGIKVVRWFKDAVKVFIVEDDPDLEPVLAKELEDYCRGKGYNFLKVKLLSRHWTGHGEWTDIKTI